MNNRIKQVRKHFNLNQTDFGNRIGVRQTTVASYENGIRTPFYAVINSICHEFDVDETWLLTGEGEMFRAVSREEEIALAVGKILKGDDDFRRRFIAVMCRLSPEQWNTVEDIFNALAEETKKEE